MSLRASLAFRCLAFISLAFCSLACTVQIAAAQTPAPQSDWPTRAIRFIVPFPAGSSTDVVSRIVTRKLGERLGQTIIVENKVGASGDLGADAIAKARPDGYTLGLGTTSTHAIAASFNPQLPYDPVRDFSHIGMVGVAPYALVVNSQASVKDVAGLIALAKAKPGQLTYSTVGPASLAHLAGDMFAMMTDTRLTSVPYGSASQAVFDVYKGLVDMQFGAVGASMELVREGKLRALGVTSAHRTASLPETPTLAEAGLAGYEAALWMAILGPADMPVAIVARVNAELKASLADPGTRNLLILQALDPEPGTPGELRERIVLDIEKWRVLAVAIKARGP